VATILVEENVEFDLDTLDTFVRAAYPDMRKCINTLQMNSLEGKLTLHTEEEADGRDYKIEMTEMFKAGKIAEARKLVCSKVRPEEIEDIFRWMYDNIEFFGDSEQQEMAILVIREGLVNHALVADPEINLAATMIKLSAI
jgi:DNA polymerase III delta prime subunit